MPGPGSKINIEHATADSEPNYGSWQDIPLPIASFRLVTGEIITASTDPQYEASGIAPNHRTWLEWAAADTDAIIAEIPSGQISLRHGFIEVVVRCGLIGAGTNADFDLLCQLTAKPRFADWDGADDPTRVTVRTAAAKASYTKMTTPANGARIDVAATEAGTVEVVFRFDIPATMDSGADLRVRIVPDQAPGTNLDFRIYGINVRAPMNASLSRRFDRPSIA